ncbi:centrosomal protein of 104 kDa isoform X2 [Brienomyrus brachyistius]|nr:centrosomal protein of 104 kDa isoform X2 [Brienomyrus brachyistius]XP_048873245.1 centrosomal protein of 104 kDa isoform X2 [Brienomyrus brachyistius]XP_048873246.1 centrosomal protein of 104 kDa isoform X2 [Brienomyrus brachyistius]
MPRKIGFAVVSSSSHEDNFSAKELMVHVPTVSGWRSARLCPYPQEVTLRLVERSRVRRIQLLAHQHLIPSKIEFHMGDNPVGPGHFHRLGYVSLSDNEKTGYKARELKSVHVDAVGTHLRLTFHKNYASPHNLYNQVALIAVNVLADAVDSDLPHVSLTTDQLIEHYLNNTQQDTSLNGTYLGKHDSISPLDDLAFHIYQDPAVAQIIRRLDERKQECVQQEQYGLAKTLKQAAADLQKVGERLARLDVEKHCAIEKEDYDTAEQKKAQMEEYRLKVYQQLQLLNLLDISQIVDFHDKKMEASFIPSQEMQSELPHDIQTEVTQEKPLGSQWSASSPLVSQCSHSAQLASPAPPEAPQTGASRLPYDEIPLPTLHNPPEGDQPQLPQPSQSGDPPGSPGVQGEPDPLTEKAQREAGLPIEVYGERLVAGIYSKAWSHRESALLAVYKKLSEMPAGTPKEEVRTTLRVTVFLLRRALKDQVYSVFEASLKLLGMVLTQFIPKHKLGKVETAHCIEQVWPNLISRTGDFSTRLRLVATDFIQEMALFKEVRPLQIIPGELVKPIPSGSLTRLALSRAQLVERLLPDVAFSVNSVMQFSIAALEHSAAAVRETAVRIILAAYGQYGEAVRAFLPSDEASARRNMVYRKIFDGLAELDGTPIGLRRGTLKRDSMQKVEKEKKEEILSLQEQVAVLSEISEKAKGKQNAKGNEKIVKLPRAGARKIHSVSPSHMGGDRSTAAGYLDSLCIFCGERSDSFTEEGLDLHYWKHCPMLCRCHHCRQVVEIAGLTEHLLAECEGRAAFAACPLCGEAVARGSLAAHSQSPGCQPPGPERKANHCPLCHDNFASGEEAWKSHLLGPDGCKQNSRRTAALQRARLPQGKTSTLRKTKEASLGPKARLVGGMSRAPGAKAGHRGTARRLPVIRR